MAKLSKKDWVRLSAYLDGELSQKEILQIEKRIQKDPVFQAALEELSGARQVLRSAPRLKAPRRFYLTPELIGAKPRSKPARGYSLAAVVLTFLFVGLVVFDFGSSISGVAFGPAAPREIMQEALPEAAMDAVEEPVLMAEEAEMEAADRAAGESQADDALGATAPAPELAAEAVEEAAAGVPEEGEAKSADEVETDAAANQADADQPAAEEEEMAAEPQPTQTLEPLPTQLPEVKETSEAVHYWEPDLSTPQVDLIRILEWVVGLGALTLGILAWIKRRRS